MALNYGDMLYYDGTKWVNSSTIVTATAGMTIEISDMGTRSLVRPILCAHALSSGSANVGCGAGVQFLATSEVGDIDCTVGAASPLASYFSLSARDNTGALVEMLRLGSTGSAPSAFFTVPLLGLLVPLQLNRGIVNLFMQSSPYSLHNYEYMNPILEITNASTAFTITFPSTSGGFWIVYNNSGQPLTLNPGARALNNGLHAVYYADGTNLQQVTTPA